MNKEIFDRIDALSLKLGTTAEYLWPLLVGAQKAKAMILFFIVVLILFCAGFFAKWAFNRDDGEIKFASAVAIFGATLLFLGTLEHCMVSIFYPEVAAFKSLVQIF